MENKNECSLKKVGVFSSPFLNKKFDIQTTAEVDKENYVLFVSCEPLPAFGPDKKETNNKNIQIAFTLKNADFQKFADEMMGVKQQYIDTAEDVHIENESSTQKNFRTDFPETTVYFYYEGKHYSADTKLQAYFRSISDQFICVITSGPLVAKEDEKMHVAGLYMPFYQPDTIDNFVKAIEEAGFNAINMK